MTFRLHGDRALIIVLGNISPIPQTQIVPKPIRWLTRSLSSRLRNAAKAIGKGDLEDALDLTSNVLQRLS